MAGNRYSRQRHHQVPPTQGKSGEGMIRPDQQSIERIFVFGGIRPRMSSVIKNGATVSENRAAKNMENVFV